MGSLYRQTVNGKVGFRFQFLPPHAGPNDKRESIWLGTDETKATTFASHVDHMVEQIRDEKPYGKPTSKWLETLLEKEPKKFDRLAEFGFCEPRKPIEPAPEPIVEPKKTLEDLVDRFLLTVVGKKQATQTKLEQAANCLIRYPNFGKDKPLEEITRGDAEEWTVWMSQKGNIREGKKRKDKDGKPFRGRTDLAENTVRRRTGLAKQIFNFAIRLKWIEENPFVGLVCTVNPNEAKMVFVLRESIQAAIDMAPDARWRAIIALGRFGGLRIPSEIARLTWQDVDFETGRMRIHASKTEHLKGKGIRFCPIFPELKPYLEDLRNLAQPGLETPLTECVIEDAGSSANLRTQFLKIIKKAGLNPWPRIFQNLRASRETELLSKYPAKDACTWIGNSEAVAMRHYAMATSESFSRATLEPSGQMPNRAKLGTELGNQEANGENQQQSQENGIDRIIEESLGKTGQKANETGENSPSEESVKGKRNGREGTSASNEKQSGIFNAINVGQSVGQSSNPIACNHDLHIELVSVLSSFGIEPTVDVMAAVNQFIRTVRDSVAEDDPKTKDKLSRS
jgi:integrase